MAYEPKDMSGSLFKNDRKEADTHPDYKGSALIGGVDHWLDAWINTDRNGNKYMSLKLKPKDQQAGGNPAPRQAAPASQFDDDSEVPF
jgi:hypothetical protein